MKKHQPNSYISINLVSIKTSFIIPWTIFFCFRATAWRSWLIDFSDGTYVSLLLLCHGTSTNFSKHCMGSSFCWHWASFWIQFYSSNLSYNKYFWIIYYSRVAITFACNSPILSFYNDAFDSCKKRWHSERSRRDITLWKQWEVAESCLYIML